MKDRFGDADDSMESANVTPECGRSVMVMSRIGLLAVLISLTGCLYVRHPGFVIPARCVRVSVQSFTKPCSELRDGRFVCNGVLIAASCTAPPTAKAAR